MDEIYRRLGQDREAELLREAERLHRGARLQRHAGGRGWKGLSPRAFVASSWLRVRRPRRATLGLR